MVKGKPTLCSSLWHAPSAADNIKADLLGPILALLELPLEQVHVVLAVCAVRFVGQDADRVEGSISVPPHFEALYRPYTLDFSKAICPPVYVGPHNINIIESDQVSPA